MTSSSKKDDAFVDISLQSYEGGSLGKDKSMETKEPMLSMSTNNSPKHIRTASTKDEVHCGIGACRLDFCQRKLSAFTAICSLSSLFTHAITMYISSQIPMLEKQFHLKSSQSGFIISCNEIGFLLTVLVASHFGRNWHIPRFMAFCTVMFGVATFCISGAFFVRPETPWDSIHEFSHTHHSNFSRESLAHAELDLLCTPHTFDKDHHEHDDGKEDCHFKSHKNLSKTHAAYSIFIVFMILQGMAKAPRSSLVPLYVDNNVSDQSKTGFLMGIIFTAQLLGPGLAFGLGALASKIPVDLHHHEITTDDPRWLGAWWLGFVVIGLSGLIGVPLVCFPRSLMKREAIFRANLNSKKNELEAVESTLMENIKALPKSLGRVLKNPVYILSLLSSTVFLLVMMGLYAFAAKYLEVVFLVSPTKANIIMSCISMVASGLGTMLGGIISSRLRLTVPSLMKVKLIILALVLVIDLSCLFLGCDQPQITNNPEIFPRSAELSKLIHNCSCVHGDFFPICGSDNKTYFSPCHAGCGSFSDFKFHSCTIIPDGMAAAGICDKSCNSLYIFMVLFFITDLIGTIDIVPTYLIMIRTQTEKDKSVAMGFGSFILSAFAFLPAPLLFGKFIDMACIIWETDCDIQGSCQLYDISMIRKLLFIPLLSGRFLALLLIILAFCFASKTPQPGDTFRKEVAEAMKVHLETTSL